MDNKASTLLCLLFRSPAVAPVQKQVAVLHLQAHQWLPLYIVRDRAHTGRDFCSIISWLSANNSQTPRAVCLYSLGRKCWRVQRWSFNSSLLSPCFFFPAFRDEFHLKSCHDSKKKEKKTKHKPHVDFSKTWKLDEQERSSDGWPALPCLAGRARLPALLVRLVEARLCPRRVLDGGSVKHRAGG